MHIARYALYLAVPILGAALYFLTPLPRPLFAPDYSTLIVARDGQLLRAFLNRDQQWCFPPDTSLAVPAKLRTAVLHFEDRRFYRHLGVDPLALGRALYQNAASGAVKSGASTITMQVARLMHPKERTYVNKAFETLLALKIEFYYAKDEILRLYLDHAPYGGNIVGYQAAAHKYFRKPPDELTWSEAATLAVLPNAPGLVSPTANPQQLVQKRNQLLTSLQRAGHFNAETLRLALAEPVPTRAFPYPVGAPHLSRALKRGRQGRLIKTTIDASLQRELEALVGRHLRYLDHQGIGNGAALLVETGSGKVRAYPAWTIAVWLGNFSGEGNPALSGAQAAGPLLFDIFHRVPKDLDQAWFSRPDADLTIATLCRDSGRPVGPHCPHPTQALVPQHRRPMDRCPYHRSIVLNTAGTHQVCSLCWQPGDHRLAQQTVYPTDVVQYLRERGQVLHDPPPHKADCPVQSEAKPLQVLYPTPEARLQVGRDFDGKQQPIVLRAAHSDQERALFWYVNRRFLGRTVNQHRLAVSLEPGAHALEIVDAHGFRDRARFYVVR